MRFGVYVHLPWCRTRCHHCSFNLQVRQDPPQRAYTDALLRQWDTLAPLFGGPPNTLYLGGGTPSLHPPEQIAQLVRTIGAPHVEMEANPEDLHLAPAWARAGVTRLSVGAQSFDSRQVRFLNRAHDAESLAVRLAPLADLFDSWSVDLIFGMPEQTLDDLERDLEQLLATDPPHVSLYGLTVYPGTALDRAVKEGRVLLDDTVQADMLEHIVERLRKAGRSRYEVSNFALAAHRSSHNESIWRGDFYAGLGAGAHGWLPDGRRTVGVMDPDHFIATRLMKEEWPDRRQAAVDLIITMMRHVDGLPLSRLSALGFDLNRDALTLHQDRGRLHMGDSIALSGRGWMHADALLAAVVDALVG